MTDTDPFWAGLEAGQLRLQRCVDCECPLFPPGPICPHCHGSDLSWTTVEPTGDLYAFTRQHRTAPGVPEPVVVGLVSLDAGPRLLARVDGAYGELTLGQRVRIVPWDYDEGVDRGDLADRPFFRIDPSE